MSSSSIPTASIAPSPMNSSIYTAFSSAIATNSSSSILPTSTIPATLSQSATLLTTTSSSVATATPSFNPQDCILQPYQSSCFNVSGSTVNSAQNVAGLSAQMITCSSVGVLCFLLFCALRTKWTILYQPRIHMKRHSPPILPTSLFGWIIPLIRISHDEVLEKVGMDAVVMLQFLLMSFKLFAFCSFFGVTVLVPISVSVSHVAKNDPSALTIIAVEDSERYMIAYLIFTYLFSFVAFWLMYGNYDTYVRLRRQYLIRNKKALSVRTVMVTGIPHSLRNDQKLAEYFEDLGLGPVESAHVVRRVKNLRAGVQRRGGYLRNLETMYAKYWGNPVQDPNYDPDSILDEAETVEPSNLAKQNSNVPFIVKKKERPTTRTGFWGLWGEKVDAIDYYTEKFTSEDDKVMELRSRIDFDVSSVGFVTFENIVGAQLAAQVLVDGEPFKMRTKLAKEPRDVYWKSILIPGRIKIIRVIIAWIILIFIAVFWVGPIALLSLLTSPQTLVKIAPGLVDNQNPLVQAIFQGILPPLAVNIFMALMPLILDALGQLQGISSRSDLADATLSKYFFFLLVNVLLVFTFFSSLGKTIQNIITNPSSIASLLASSLPQVAPFFVNYVILKGIMLTPLELLLIGSIFVRGFNYSFLCKTPRDYAEARAPPTFSYGWSYPNSLLVFVIVMVYSTISPLILLFGMSYFGLQYFVYKYQFLYVYFTPYETAGGAWPNVFPRLLVGMLIFQLTMTGLFFLKTYIVLGALCVPLIALTVLYWVVMNQAYSRSSKSLPLQILKEDMMKLPTHVDLQDVMGDRRKSNRPASLLSVSSGQEKEQKDGPRVTLHDATPHQEETLEHDRPIGSEDTFARDNEPVRKHSRLRKRVALDFDDYEAVPDKLTDYRQPPQSLNSGILDTGLRRYGNPALVGVLPQLWLPVKANNGDQPASQRRPKNRPRGSSGHIPATLSNIVRRAESARKVVTGKARTVRRPRRKAAVQIASAETVDMSGQQPLANTEDDTTAPKITIPNDQPAHVVTANGTYPSIHVEEYHGANEENTDRYSIRSGQQHPTQVEETPRSEENDDDTADGDDNDDSDQEAPEIHKTYYHHPERHNSSSNIAKNLQS
ncbi:hypothetical protein BC943DRAFT_318002 [Umbelopsis sp. AD052]|nr:hypothetical protein BC943DRAFT_318002 [Umbelopsis sp. AD052]